MTQPLSTDQPSVASISDDIDDIDEPAITGPGFFRRTGRWVWRLTRMLLILALVAAIGLAVFYGWPIVKERYIDPIAANSTAVQTAESRLSTTEERLTDLEAQVGAIVDAETEVPLRLDTLENELAALTEAEGALDTRIGTVERQIERHTTRLDTLAELQAGLATDLTGVSDESRQQVELLRSMELLSRARLFLFQANYGLAKADLVTARAALSDVETEYPEFAPDVMTEVLLRLDRSIAALPSFPVVAADDLDIAWQVLLTQVAPETPVAPTAGDAAPESAAN